MINYFSGRLAWGGGAGGGGSAPDLGAVGQYEPYTDATQCYEIEGMFVSSEDGHLYFASDYGDAQEGTLSRFDLSIDAADDEYVTIQRIDAAFLGSTYGSTGADDTYWWPGGTSAVNYTDISVADLETGTTSLSGSGAYYRYYTESETYIAGTMSTSTWASYRKDDGTVETVSASLSGISSAYEKFTAFVGTVSTDEKFLVQLDPGYEFGVIAMDNTTDVGSFDSTQGNSGYSTITEGGYGWAEDSAGNFWILVDDSSNGFGIIKVSSAGVISDFIALETAGTGYDTVVSQIEFQRMAYREDLNIIMLRCQKGGGDIDTTIVSYDIDTDTLSYYDVDPDRTYISNDGWAMAWDPTNKYLWCANPVLTQDNLLIKIGLGE
jgi:hypothetical protein